MLYRKIIACLSLSLTICCLTSGNARAVPCSNPSCENLGFIYTASQCGNHAALKCPFDSSKFFCDAQISVPKTCEESLIAAGLAPVTNSDEFIKASTEGKEIVLMNSVVVDTGALHVRNNVYLPSSINSRFPLCTAESAPSALSSSEDTFYVDQSASGDVITIYPYTSDETYGTEINNPVVFKNGAYFDTLVISSGSNVTLENGQYMITYDSDFVGTDLTATNNALVLFYGDFTNISTISLSKNSCIEDRLSYKICAAESAVITPRNGSQLVIPDDTANYSGEFTTNCMEGTTAQYLDQPKTCEGYNKKPVYGWPGQNITSWCPVTYSTSSYITCQSGYQVSQSKEYPGCYICREVVSDAKKQQCADEKTACYKSADTKRDKCVQKANIDRENCAYRASEAYDNCISMGGWWYDCDQTKQQAWDDCDYTYTYDDLDWCTSTHATDYDDCDTSYDNCLEGKELSVVDDSIVCMKCP